MIKKKEAIMYAQQFAHFVIGFIVAGLTMFAIASCVFVGLNILTWIRS